eukprot:6376455-Amphidinium_carterae.1
MHASRCAQRPLHQLAHLHSESHSTDIARNVTDNTLGLWTKSANSRHTGSISPSCGDCVLATVRTTLIT